MDSSQANGTTYTVDISGISTSCTCQEWLKHELPCKHVFAVLQHGGISWEDFPDPFRTNPLFNLDDDAEQLLHANTTVDADLEEMARAIEAELDNPVGAVFNELDIPVEDAQDAADDDEEIIPPSQVINVPSSQTEDGANLRAIIRIRELCKAMTENSHFVENKDVSLEVCDELSALCDKFAAAMPVGIPRYKKGEYRQKTLKQITSAQRYRGRRVLAMPRRSNKGQKRARGDLQGMEEMSQQIKNVADLNRMPKVRENLWPKDDISEEELNNILESEYADIFVTPEVKESLLQGKLHSAFHHVSLYVSNVDAPN